MTQVELLAHLRSVHVAGKRSVNPTKQARAAVAHAALHCLPLPHEAAATCRILRAAVPDASDDQIVYLVRRVHPTTAESEIRDVIAAERARGDAAWDAMTSDLK